MLCSLAAVLCVCSDKIRSRYLFDIYAKILSFIVFEDIIFFWIHFSAMKCCLCGKEGGGREGSEDALLPVSRRRVEFARKSCLRSYFLADCRHCAATPVRLGGNCLGLTVDREGAASSDAVRPLLGGTCFICMPIRLFSSLLVIFISRPLFHTL